VKILRFFSLLMDNLMKGVYSCYRWLFENKPLLVCTLLIYQLTQLLALFYKKCFEVKTFRILTPEV